MHQKERKSDIMDNFTINGVKVSEEQYHRIKNMRRVSDDEIDFSDIPEITDEEWKKFKPARLRKKKFFIKFFRGDLNAEF